jgi:hypothetical protein
MYEKGENMDLNEKRWSLSAAIFMAIVLAIVGMTAAPDAFAKFGRIPDTDGEMAPMTGRIDKIETKRIIIDDTSFTLSKQVPIEGYKVGDRVTFTATFKYEIIKIGHSNRIDKKKQPKE